MQVPYRNTFQQLHVGDIGPFISRVLQVERNCGRLLLLTASKMLLLASKAFHLPSAVHIDRFGQKLDSEIQTTLQRYASNLKYHAKNNLPLLIIDREAFPKKGDNVLGSVHPNLKWLFIIIILLFFGIPHKN